MVNLKFTSQNGTVEQKTFKFDSKRRAKALYYLLIDNYQFYCGSIETQYDSNFTFLNLLPVFFRKGKYHNKFEHCRSGTQLYDDVRRIMFNVNQNVAMRLQVDDLVEQAGGPGNSDCHVSSVRWCLDVTDFYLFLQSIWKDQSCCKICFDRPLATAFVPCGHSVCDRCADRPGAALCPFCKTPIEGRLSIYLWPMFGCPSPWCKFIR